VVAHAHMRNAQFKFHKVV